MHDHTPPDTNLPKAIDQFLAGNPACLLCQGPRGKDDIIGIYDVSPPCGLPRHTGTRNTSSMRCARPVPSFQAWERELNASSQRIGINHARTRTGE